MTLLADFLSTVIERRYKTVAESADFNSITES